MKLAYAAAATLCLGWVLWRSLPEWNANRIALSPLGSAGFVLAWITMIIVLGAAWAGSLAAFSGIKLTLRQWLTVQAAAWAGRYLPGKVGLLAGKLAVARTHGVRIRVLGYSVLYEQFGFVVAGIAVFLAAQIPASSIGLADIAFPERTQILSVVLAAACVIAFGVLANAASPLVGGRRSSLLRLQVLGACHVLAHIVAGLGFFTVLRGIAGLEDLALPYAVGVFAAANVAGILAFFAPAGIGVREAVIAVGLVPFVPLEIGIAIAAVLRLLSVVADALFCSVAASLALPMQSPRS